MYFLGAVNLMANGGREARGGAEIKREIAR